MDPEAVSPRPPRVRSAKQRSASRRTALPVIAKLAEATFRADGPAESAGEQQPQGTSHRSFGKIKIFLPNDGGNSVPSGISQLRCPQGGANEKPRPGLARRPP